EPVGYLELLFLCQNAVLILTDSGGLQEEAFTLGVPCLTLRTTTDRPETLSCRSNRLIDPQSLTIGAVVNSALDKRDEIVMKINSSSNPFGDGKASERILTILEREWLNGSLLRKVPEFQGQTYPTRLLISTSKVENKQEKLVTSFDKAGRPFYPPQKEKGWKHLVMGLQSLEE
ncbi:MAG: UDP-N-acetylglucosamine 2-epimerase, partial [Promethearchaeota archaeon]